MFYNTKDNNHGLRYNPFKACVVPRPIGWISTINGDGVENLAPFSYFNAVSDSPPVIMFSSSLKQDKDLKDTIKNIKQVQEFVFNLATYDLRQEMMNTGVPLPYGVSEAKEYGIEMESSMFVNPPRVKMSPVSLECRVVRELEIDVENESCGVTVVFGHVVGIYINDEFIVDGKLDILKLKPIARLGYDQYALIDTIFTIKK